MVRREALNRVGLLDERFFMYGEDKDWCKRFWDAGWNVVYYPYAKIIHYGGGSSSNSPIRFYVEMYRSELQYWRKYHSKILQLIYSLIVDIHHIIRLFGEVSLYLLKPSFRNVTVFKIRRIINYFKWRLGFKYCRPIIDTIVQNNK